MVPVTAFVEYMITAADYTFLTQKEMKSCTVTKARTKAPHLIPGCKAGNIVRVYITTLSFKFKSIFRC